MTHDGEDMTLLCVKAKLCDTAKTAEKIRKDILTLTGKPLNPCPEQKPVLLKGGMLKGGLRETLSRRWKFFSHILEKPSLLNQLSRKFSRLFRHYQVHGVARTLLMSAKWKKRERNNSEAGLSPGPGVLIISVWREIWKIQLKELSKGFINRALPPTPVQRHCYVLNQCCTSQYIFFGAWK